MTISAVVNNEISNVMEQLYDLSALEEVTGGDQDFMNNMINLFITSAPEDLGLMQDALEKGEYATVSKIAHKMKPSVNYMCVPAMFDKVKEIEAWAGDEQQLVADTKVFIQDISSTLSQLENR